jgi:CRP-like cAMP-binding protein
MPDFDLDALAKVSKLFEALDAPGRLALLRASTKRACADGEVICREGEPGEDFFVISKGQVRVTADDFGSAKELAVLGPSQFFGEMAALSGHRRTATATAVGAVELVVFPSSAVREVLETRPAAREVLSRVGLLRSEQTMAKLMES